MVKVTDIKKSPEPAKKGVLTRVKEVVAPPKTEAQLREDHMIKKWNLKKDPKIPHRYWLNEYMYITFIPGDEESILKAEQTLEKYFRAPQIESASKDIASSSPYATTDKGKKGTASYKKGGFIGALAEVSTEVEPIARNAAKASEQALTVEGLGFDPVKAQDHLYSMKGVPKHGQVGYNDFMGEDPVPKPHSKSKSKRTKQKRKGDDFL